MPQDSESGGRTAKWGRETRAGWPANWAPLVYRTRANECVLDGTQTVITCAAIKTDDVGVTYKMLDRLDAVIGAFELDDGSFELWSVTPEHFRGAMTETRSLGPSAGLVGIVRKSHFEQQGRSLGRVTPA
jgi:hypothetical protein